MKKTLFIILTLTLHHYSTLYAQDINTNNGTFLMELKDYANRLEYFPLQKIIFNSSFWCVDDFFAESKNGCVFYEFMEFARRAKENDLEECVKYLNQAIPRERALILMVLHCSLETKYLPIVGEYVNDKEIAFPTWASYRETNRDQLQKISVDDFFNPTRLKNVMDKGEKISRLELICWMRDSVNSSAGPLDYFSESFGSRNASGKSVAKFARAILTTWGWKYENKDNMNIEADNMSYDWPIPTEEDWELYESRNHLLCYYANMYLTQVECSQPEYYDTATRVFLGKVEKLSVKYRILVLLRTGLYQQGYNQKKDKNIFVLLTTKNYPFPCTPDHNLVELALKNERNNDNEWITMLKQIPKDELINLMITKTPETIDPDILFSFKFYSNSGAYSLMKYIILQYKDSLFTAKERETIINNVKRRC